MPHRRLVQIGKTVAPPPPASLPTIAEYFRDLAARQGEDIRLLKARAEEEIQKRAQRRAKGAKSVREESWRLHPMVSSENSGKSKKLSANRKKSSATRAKARKS